MSSLHALAAGTGDACAPETARDLTTLLREGRKFGTIYADPPWTYKNASSRAAAVNRYRTLSLAEISSLPVKELATPNCHLHLWATSPLLEDALKVMHSWGFKYKSSLVWVKDKVGLGNYWRISHELLLLGVRGNLRFADRTVRSWVNLRRTIHSQKPEEVRLLIERVSPPPYLELFGRAEVHVANWTVFGDQVERKLF